MHQTFTDADRAFIESVPFFFLSTAWNDSVDCSMQGGVPGFVRVTAPNTGTISATQARTGCDVRDTHSPQRYCLPRNTTPKNLKLKHDNGDDRVDDEACQEGP